MEIYDILNAILIAEENNRNNTNISFPEHMRLLTEQNKCLLDFLVNYNSSTASLLIDSNAFLIIFGLLADGVKKEKTCIRLLTEGYYDEAFSLIRTIFENCSHILFLCSNSAEYKNWIEFNKHQNDLIVNNQSPNPHTVFDLPFKQFLEKIKLGQYYPLYRKLSSYSHTSYSVLTSNFAQVKNATGGQMYNFAPKYDAIRLEFGLNVLYGMVDIPVSRGVSQILEFQELPKSLNEYENMRYNAGICFDKFYDTKT